MKTIVIADDEASLRLLVSATLASEHYRIVEASDGDKALELIQRNRPSLALLDVQMPGRTGLEITRAVKSDPELASMKVILLTSKAQEVDVREGLAAGADLYLTKPFSPLELLTIVEEAVGVA